MSNLLAFLGYLMMRNFLWPHAKCTNTNNSWWATKWPMHKFCDMCHPTIRRLHLTNLMQHPVHRVFYKMVEQMTSLQITKEENKHFKVLKLHWSFIVFVIKAKERGQHETSVIFDTIFKRNALISGWWKHSVLIGYSDFNSQCASFLEIITYKYKCQQQQKATIYTRQDCKARTIGPLKFCKHT